MMGNRTVAMAAILLSLLSCQMHNAASDAEALTAAREASARESARAVHSYVCGRQKAVRQYIAKLSPEARAAQLFLVNINGDSNFSPVEEVVPGGYLFFYYNVADSAQGVKDFVASIRRWCAANKAIMPYLAVDEEGGDVERLRKVAARLPSASTVAQTMTTAEAAALYSEVAWQMHSMGFNLNLAPVAEAANDRNKAMLDTRLYGDATAAAQYGAVCVAAYQSRSVAAAIKHFPGNASTDPHTGESKAVITDEALKAEISSFMHLIHCGAEAVVMSHVRFNDYPPACLSNHWIEVLREAGFTGLVISDDIFMTALEDGYSHEDAAMLAVRAGVDVIMLSDKRFSTLLKAIEMQAEDDAAFAKQVEDACYKVVLFKLHHGVISMEDIR